MNSTAWPRPRHAPGTGPLTRPEKPAEPSGEPATDDFRSDGALFSIGDM